MINRQKSIVSPQPYARLAGALYVLLIITGVFSVLFVRDKLVVPGNALATTTNIITSQSLWRRGIAADLLMHVCDIPVMVIFYLLLKPVNKTLALSAMLFNIVQTAVLVSVKLNLVASIFPVGDYDYAAGVTPGLKGALVYHSVRLHDYGFGIGLIFFGFTCLINGHLIYKSGYLPKIIGILLQVAGVCYLINSFVMILYPALSHKLFLVILLPCFIAEVYLAGWLLIKGVNMTSWSEKTK